MNTNLNKTQVTFIPVENNQMKQASVCNLISQLFLEKRKILILVQNQQAADFIDQLLWKYPPESFLPHCIIHTPSQDPIVITTAPQNWNNADVLINLCMEISSLTPYFFQIYELLDHTHPQKLENSLHKKACYEKSNISINFG